MACEDLVEVFEMPSFLVVHVLHEWPQVRICFVDYDRDVVLVVEREVSQSQQKEIIAVGRLTRNQRSNSAEFAILVSDDYQGRGIGKELLRQLLATGKKEGITHVEAYMLPDNGGMRAISKQLGFSFSIEDGVVKAEIDLKD